MLHKNPRLLVHYERHLVNGPNPPINCYYNGKIGHVIKEFVLLERGKRESCGRMKYKGWSDEERCNPALLTKSRALAEANMKTILVVEDAELNIDLITQLLEDDYNLLVARDGGQGVAMARENNPDRLRLDLHACSEDSAH